LALQIMKEPHLAQFRASVKTLQKSITAEPNDATVTRAWDAIDDVIDALRQLCPNHPAVASHLIAKRLGA